MKSLAETYWLMGCEYSAVVRDAFRKKGINAYSCDIEPTEGDPDFHFQNTITTVLNGGMLKTQSGKFIYIAKWDGMIAFPPCTYLTIAGAAYYKDQQRMQKRWEATAFFKRLQNASIERIAIENPIPFKSVQSEIGKYDQYVNPYDFGTPERKRICLWLKNLPLLKPTNPVEAPIKKTYIRKTGPKAGQPYHTYYHQGKSAKERARFWPCIAEAMADQWGELPLTHPVTLCGKT